MSDAQQPISDYCRETAKQLRQLARVSRLTDIRGDLLELSARFERIAIYVDAAIRFGAPGFPRGELLPVARDHPESVGASVLSRLLYSRENYTAFANAARLRPARRGVLIGPAQFRSPAM